MPSDDLDLNEPTEEPTEPGGNEPTDGAEPAAQPGGLTLDQIQGAVDKAVSAARGEQATELRALQDQLATITEALPKPAPATTAADADELATRLLTDTEGTLREQITKWAQENLGPALQRDFEVKRDERIASRRSQFDAQYGDGAFDQIVSPVVLGKDGAKGTIHAYPTNQQADPMVIDACIKAAMGEVVMDSERFTDLQNRARKTEAAAREREVSTPPHMLAVGRRPGVKPRLTQEVKDGLETVRLAGVDISEKDLLDAMGRGGSIDDWEGVFGKQPGAGGGRAAGARS